MTNTILKLIVLAAMLVAAAFGAKPVSCEIPVTFEISNGAQYGIRSDGRGLYDGIIYCSGDATLNLIISHDRKVTAQFGVALDPGDPPYTDFETVQAWLQVRNVLLQYNKDADYTITTTFGSRWGFARGDRGYGLLNPCADNPPRLEANAALFNNDPVRKHTTAMVNVRHIPASQALDGKEQWVATPSTDTEPNPCVTVDELGQSTTWPPTVAQLGAVTATTKKGTPYVEGYYQVPFEITIRSKQ